MNTEQARTLVNETFPQVFSKGRFRQFTVNLLNHIDESKAQVWNSTYIKDAFKAHIKSYERIGTYTSPDGEKLDVLIVLLTDESKLQRTRTAIRNFVADHLKTRDGKEAALVAFVSPSEQKNWRFSYIKMEYAAFEKEDGKVGVHTKLTPARRSSYIVGDGESCHTAQSRFLNLLQDTENHPTLAQIEDAFSVEAVTKEFFDQYKALFLDLKDELDKLTKEDKIIGTEFADKRVSPADFAKKLMGQIVFLYFLQKKGWLGVPKGRDWGDGPHNFLRQLFDGKVGSYKNLFNDILEPLFYYTLATDRGHTAMCEIFKCRIPFLNGGLFEPLAGYDWQKTEIIIPNSLFSNAKTTSTGDIGTGILDVFDRYNFTVNEAEPLEKEVAIDPEMLGKVFENLLEVKERKSKGSFYTPREIVHYMCQESLINYLNTAVNSSDLPIAPSRPKQTKLFGEPDPEQTGFVTTVHKELIPLADIETFIHSGDQASYYEAARIEGTSYQRKLPKTIETHARLLDDKLAAITVCDPAIGSGAFPVGMMQEIVRARSALTPYFNDVRDRTAYHFKRHAIQNSLYGVDIDPGAAEIAKLRLWLSLVVDEDDVKQLKPLPNLDYKIVVGNSLLGVEKNLFNAEPFKRLEELKPRYFDATDRNQKEQYKHDINDLIHILTNGKEAFDFEIYFSEVFHNHGGFDVVIGNPPYGGSIDSHRGLFSRLYPHTTKQFRDIYKVFIELALSRLCSSMGILCYITPNTLLRQTRYKDARQFLLGFTILELVNLGEDVFEQVVVPTCFFFVRKDKPTNNIVTLRDLSQSSKFSGHLLTASPKLVQQNHFTKTPDNAFAEEHEQLEKSQAFLEDVIQFRDAGINYQRVNVGMEEKGKSDLGQRLLYEGNKKKTADVEFWKGVDIDKYFIAEHTGRFVSVSTASELRSNERVVLNRKFFQSTPKLVWRQTASCLIAAVDDRGIWFGRSIQAGVIKPTKQHLDYRYLCGVLNSSYLRFKYDRLVREEGRVFPQVKWAKIRGLTIPDIKSKEQQPVITLVDKITAAKQLDPHADTTALEREIDELVYALYGLTEEDKSIVKGTTR